MMKKTIRELRQELQKRNLEAKGRKVCVVELAEASNVTLVQTVGKCNLVGWGKQKECFTEGFRFVLREDGLVQKI